MFGTKDCRFESYQGHCILSKYSRIDHITHVN